MPETLTSTSTTAPWATQAPYLTQGFQAAQNLYLQPQGTGFAPRPQTWFNDPRFATNPLGQYASSTVANLTPETGQQVQNIMNLANQPNILNPAERYARQAMSGQYLSPESNPYLADMVTAASQAARDQFLTQNIPGLSSKFGLAGRTGSPGMANAFNQLSAGYGRGIANIATKMYGTAYENERERQQEMARFAPDLLQARAEMYGTALDAQDILNEQRQRELTDRVNQYKFEQRAPSEALDRFLRSVSGQFGSQSTGTEQVFKPEAWTQAAGGLLALQQAGLLGGGNNDSGGVVSGFLNWLGRNFPGS